MSARNITKYLKLFVAHPNDVSLVLSLVSIVLKLHSSKKTPNNSTYSILLTIIVEQWNWRNRIVVFQVSSVWQEAGNSSRKTFLSQLFYLIFHLMSNFLLVSLEILSEISSLFIGSVQVIQEISFVARCSLVQCIIFPIASTTKPNGVVNMTKLWPIKQVGWRERERRFGEIESNWRRQRLVRRTSVDWLHRPASSSFDRARKKLSFSSRRS